MNLQHFEALESYSLQETRVFLLLTPPARNHKLPLEPYVPMSSLSSNLTPLSEQRRSQRVLLRIPIAVIASGADKKMARELTNTLVVNAHGGLIHLDLAVKPGQLIILQNPETAEEESCRVIHVHPVLGARTEVGIEFVRPSRNFWHVAFPPEDWNPPAPESRGDTL
jgi:hypothetical protein